MILFQHIHGGWLARVDGFIVAVGSLVLYYVSKFFPDGGRSVTWFILQRPFLLMCASLLIFVLLFFS